MLIVVVTVCAVAVAFSAIRKNREENTLIIACGDDTAGMVIDYVLRDSDLNAQASGFDSLNVGDCCGSNAQFTLTDNKVGMAVLCPDAARKFISKNRKYTILGTVTCDSNVLAWKDPDTSPDVIGYMSQRDEQVRILRSRFGTGVQLKPMFTSGLVYAMESGAVNGAVLDATVAEGTDFKTEIISENQPTSVLVVKKNLIGTDLLDDFIKQYNSTVDGLSNDDELWSMLRSWQGDGDHKIKGKRAEVLNKWKKMNVKIKKLDRP
ncbi:ABC transporter substrate-binding (seleno)protein SaoB [Mobilibacterium timonense]|uniref:ABC transporter substrate-binding (seleno)protein SaoB n=1 Tax=Mobilibacterium timonense TaxID=1871012 RepID=UPI003A948FF3